MLAADKSALERELRVKMLNLQCTRTPFPLQHQDSPSTRKHTHTLRAASNLSF